MTIERIEKLARCPAAVRLGVEALHQLHEQRWTDGSTTGLGYDHRALLAFSESGEPIGVLIYEENEWNNTIFISLGYVVPEARRQGAYRALWNELVNIAREKKFLRISGTTHCDNYRMQAAARGLGRRLEWLTYEYDLGEERERGEDNGDQPLPGDHEPR